jgi:hypothetical protein
VCAARLEQLALKTKPGEILVIHELMHSLGLGENPPSSQQIRVAAMRRGGYARLTSSQPYRYSRFDVASRRS